MSRSPAQPDGRLAGPGAVNGGPQPAPPPAERLLYAGRLGWAVVGMAGALVVVGAVVWAVRAILPPLLLAVILVVLLNPLVERLQRHSLPRGAAAGIVYLSGAALLAGAAMLVLPGISGQVRGLQEEWPEVSARFEGWLDGAIATSEGSPLEFTRDDLDDALAGAGAALRDQGRHLLRLGESLLNGVIIIITAPVVAFYLLADLPRLQRVAQSLLPPAVAPHVVVVARRLEKVIGGFLRGQLVVATIVGLLSTLGLALLGVPFWLVLGFIAGASDLVPLIGPIVGAVPATAVALITGGPAMAGWVLLLMIGLQQLESHVISPLVLKRAVKLHPAAVILSLLAGGNLFGFLGILLAAPTVAALKVVAGYAWRVYILGGPGEADGEGDRPPPGEEDEDDDGGRPTPDRAASAV